MNRAQTIIECIRVNTWGRDKRTDRFELKPYSTRYPHASINSVFKGVMLACG